MFCNQYAKAPGNSKRPRDTVMLKCTTRSGERCLLMELTKVVIIPDSFKGVLTSAQAADIIAAEVVARRPECEIIKIPIADGGEGSVDTLLSAVGGVKLTACVLSPDDRQIDAYYGITADGTAIIEMAQSSGLTRQDGLHPMTSNTYGFGQLILAALDKGARELVLCIGGSATTDGGCGMAAALGVRFFDTNGGEFVPCGGTLTKISRIDMAGIDARVRDSKLTVMCDVDNPLYGAKGAAYVFGPQKGASPQQVRELDAGLRHLGALWHRQALEDIPGSGAAGGLGGGCMAYLGAELVSGIDAILKLCRFKERLKGADLIITGEGRLDAQSFNGKVLSGILREAGDVPVISICGVCQCDEALLRAHSLTVYETSEDVSIAESMRNPERHLKRATRKMLDAAVCFAGFTQG